MAKKKTTKRRRPQAKSTTSISMGPLRDLTNETLEQYRKFRRDGRETPKNKDFVEAAIEALERFQTELNTPRQFCPQPAMDPDKG